MFLIESKKKKSNMA